MKDNNQGNSEQPLFGLRITIINHNDYYFLLSFYFKVTIENKKEQEYLHFIFTSLHFV